MNWEDLVLNLASAVNSVIGLKQATSRPSPQSLLFSLPQIGDTGIIIRFVVRCTVEALPKKEWKWQSGTR